LKAVWNSTILEVRYPISNKTLFSNSDFLEEKRSWYKRFMSGFVKLCIS